MMLNWSGFQAAPFSWEAIPVKHMTSGGGTIRMTTGWKEMGEYEANSLPTRSRSRASGCTAIRSRLRNIFALCSRQAILLPLIQWFTRKRTAPGLMVVLVQERCHCLSALSPGKMPWPIVSGRLSVFQQKQNGSMRRVVPEEISFPGAIAGKREGAAVLMR
jgi:hypothetical protein